MEKWLSKEDERFLELALKDFATLNGSELAELKTGIKEGRIEKIEEVGRVLNCFSTNLGTKLALICEGLRGFGA